MTEPTSSRRGFEITTGEAAERGPLKISERVARDIVDFIVRTGLKPGDTLPSEAEMLAEYGVARGSLREALRLLETQGFISLRRGPGGGPVIGHLDPGNVGRMLTFSYHLAGATYDELLEAWVLCERTLAGLAATHPDREAVQAAMAPYIAREVPETSQDSVEEYLTAITQFHAVVASFAGNRVLELSLQAPGQIVTHHMAVGTDPRQHEHEASDAHAAVAKAISAGQERRARSAMEKHIRREVEFYRTNLGLRRDGIIDWQ